MDKSSATNIEKWSMDNLDKVQESVSLLIAGGHRDQLYEYLSLLPEQSRYMLLFSPIQKSPSIIQQIINSSENIDYLLEDLFLNNTSRNNQIIKPLLTNQFKPLGLESGKNFLHIMASGSYLEIDINYLNTLSSVGFDFADMGFDERDSEGKNPFEIYIDRIHGDNGFTGELYETDARIILQNIVNLISVGIGLYSDESKLENDSEKNKNTLKKLFFIYNIKQIDKAGELSFPVIYSQLIQDLSKDVVFRMVDKIILDPELEKSDKGIIIQTEIDYVIARIESYNEYSQEEKERFFSELSQIGTLFDHFSNLMISSIIELENDINKVNFEFLKEQFRKNPSIINRLDDKGHKISYYAIKNKDLDGLHFLLESGFDFREAFEIAREEGNEEIFKVISQYFVENQFEEIISQFKKELGEGFMSDSFTTLEEELHKFKDIISYEYLEPISINVELVKDTYFDHESLDEENISWGNRYDDCLRTFNKFISRDAEEIILEQQAAIFEEIEEESEEEEIKIVVEKKRKLESSDNITQKETVLEPNNDFPPSSTKRARSDNLSSNTSENSL